MGGGTKRAQEKHTRKLQKREAKEQMFCHLPFCGATVDVPCAIEHFINQFNPHESRSAQQALDDKRMRRVLRKEEKNAAVDKALKRKQRQLRNSAAQEQDSPQGKEMVGGAGEAPVREEPLEEGKNKGQIEEPQGEGPFPKKKALENGERRIEAAAKAPSSETSPTKGMSALLRPPPLIAAVHTSRRHVAAREESSRTPACASPHVHHPFPADGCTTLVERTRSEAAPTTWTRATPTQTTQAIIHAPTPTMCQPETTGPSGEAQEHAGEPRKETCAALAGPRRPNRLSRLVGFVRSHPAACVAGGLVAGLALKALQSRH